MGKNIQGWDALHPKQKQLYELLAERETNQTMTLDEMRDVLGVNSLNTVVHHLRQLEKKGYLRKVDGSGRIELQPAPVKDIVYLNLYGMAGCSPNGFFNDDNVIDRIPFAAKQLRVKNNVFLVEARGDSMEPQIHDRDLVLVEPATVSSGDTAVVVHGEEAKLKKVYKASGHIILQSLNPKYEPVVVPLDEVRQVGVVRGVVRRFVDDI